MSRHAPQWALQRAQHSAQQQQARAQLALPRPLLNRLLPVLMAPALMGILLLATPIDSLLAALTAGWVTLALGVMLELQWMRRQIRALTLLVSAADEAQPAGPAATHQPAASGCVADATPDGRRA